MNENEHVTLERQYFIRLLVWGGGSEAEQAATTAHIATCDEGCKEALAEEQEEYQELRAMPPFIETPEEAAARSEAILRRLREHDREVALLALVDMTPEELEQEFAKEDKEAQEKAAKAAPK